MDQNRKLAQPTGVIEPCVRCRAKGIVVCPTCQGTGDIRNESYVVVDRCHDCSNDKGVHHLPKLPWQDCG